MSEAVGACSFRACARAYRGRYIERTPIYAKRWKARSCVENHLFVGHSGNGRDGWISA
jgi:hypothetical protein